FFSGERFSLVDTVFGPVFRYIDCFERIEEFGLLEGNAKTEAWRETLRQRVSIKAAVADDYPLLLRRFLEGRQSYLTSLMSRSVS
ncbi:MAG: glutathione S-transferase domain-containing protein, partial [Pseudomonadota bacterium]